MLVRDTVSVRVRFMGRCGVANYSNKKLARNKIS